MTHFTSRTDLIDWITKSVKRNRGLLRALNEGTIEVLGRFNQISSFGRGGLILKIIAPKGQIYIISVTVKDTRKTAGIYVIESVPWEYWEGDKYASTIFKGDNPEKYKELRDGQG